MLEAKGEEAFKKVLQDLQYSASFQNKTGEQRLACAFVLMPCQSQHTTDEDRVCHPQCTHPTLDILLVQVQLNAKSCHQIQHKLQGQRSQLKAFLYVT